MKEAEKTIEYLMKLMEKKEYPESVKTTVKWAIRLSEDPSRAAEQVRPVIEKNTHPREAVKAVQPLIK